MTPRFCLTPIAAVVAIMAFPALAQTATPQAPAPVNAATQAFMIPQHNCVAPQYPSKSGTTRESTTTLKGNESQTKGMESYNRQVEAFNHDAKAYEECIKKYVADTKVWMQQVADAGNKAVDEYNKYTADIRTKVDAEK